MIFEALKFCFWKFRRVSISLVLFPGAAISRRALDTQSSPRPPFPLPAPQISCSSEAVCVSQRLAGCHGFDAASWNSEPGCAPLLHHPPLAVHPSPRCNKNSIECYYILTKSTSTGALPTKMATEERSRREKYSIARVPSALWWRRLGVRQAYSLTQRGEACPRRGSGRERLCNPSCSRGNIVRTTKEMSATMGGGSICSSWPLSLPWKNNWGGSVESITLP